MLDVTFGSTYAVDAIDRAYEAKRMHHVTANERPNWPEAYRLYGVAIADAELAIDELSRQEEPRESLIAHLRSLISQWSGERHTMPRS